jgi:hypothetical protein
MAMEFSFVFCYSKAQGERGVIDNSIFFQFPNEAKMMNIPT